MIWLEAAQLIALGGLAVYVGCVRRLLGEVRKMSRLKW